MLVGGDFAIGCLFVFLRIANVRRYPIHPVPDEQAVLSLAMLMSVSIAGQLAKGLKCVMGLNVQGARALAHVWRLSPEVVD